MATKNTEKFLEQLNTYVGEQVRSKLNTFYTIVTMTNKSLGEGFKEGYQDVRKKSPNLPEIPNRVFTEIGATALNKVMDHVEKPRTMPVKMPGSRRGTKLVFGTRRDVKNVYEIAKGEGVNGINKYLESVGSRRLKSLQDYKDGDITPRQTEVGIQKSGTHRAHQATSTVGAAQLSGAMEFLTRTKDFAGFTTAETSKDLMDIYTDIALKFTTTGTKTGGGEVSLNENQAIEIFLGPRSENLAGSQETDWRNLRPILENAIRNYLEMIPIEDRSSSKSIRENAEDQVEHVTLSNIVGKNKSKKKTVKGGKTKSSRRKSSSVSTVVSKTAKNPASAPLALLGILNSKLPETVRGNMVEPRLVNRTGRFAGSVKVTDITTTRQGFPSIGYTYERERYETFELGNRQGSSNRDPRRLIDLSIRQIAAQFALGRFYTRRV
jgi:hypothetical protein